MKILFFDIESTGVPPNYKAPMSDVDNWPRIIQLAFLMADETGQTLNHFASLIQPDLWEVPSKKFWIDNGFSTEKNKLEGRPMPFVLDHFISNYNTCNCIASHNLAFDYPILGAEMIRYKKYANKDPQRIKICTMEAGMDLCKIPFGRDRRYWKSKKYKWPRLSELHRHLFGKDFEGAHDALADVMAVKNCFFEMVNRSVITLPLPYGAGAGSGI